MDDINIPLVAISVAFFAVFLSVVIVGLQAWVYNYESAETVRKTLAQDDPRTTLGAILKMQRHELQVAGYARGSTATAPASASAPASAAARATAPNAALTYRIPIDRAMDKVVAQYAAAQAARRP